MPQHQIGLRWDLQENEEACQWILDNGDRLLVVAPGDSAPQSELIDPEDTFIGAIGSCHLLSFMTEAARDGYVVAHYEDQPLGILEKNRKGKLCVGKVLLSPRATFKGTLQPSEEQVKALHQRAQEKCIISQSVRSEIILEPQF